MAHIHWKQVDQWMFEFGVESTGTDQMTPASSQPENFSVFSKSFPSFARMNLSWLLNEKVAVHYQILNVELKIKPFVTLDCILFIAKIASDSIAFCCCTISQWFIQYKINSVSLKFYILIASEWALLLFLLALATVDKRMNLCCTPVWKD